MTQYRCRFGRTLALSDSAIRNFWLRDWPNKIYSFDRNMACLQEKYRVNVKVIDEEYMYLEFPDAESYTQFKLEWS